MAATIAHRSGRVRVPSQRTLPERVVHEVEETLPAPNVVVDLQAGLPSMKKTPSPKLGQDSPSTSSAAEAPKVQACRKTQAKTVKRTPQRKVAKPTSTRKQNARPTTRRSAMVKSEPTALDKYLSYRDYPVNQVRLPMPPPPLQSGSDCSCSDRETSPPDSSSGYQPGSDPTDADRTVSDVEADAEQDADVVRPLSPNLHPYWEGVCKQIVANVRVRRLTPDEQEAIQGLFLLRFD